MKFKYRQNHYGDRSKIMVTFGFSSSGFLVGRSMRKPSRGNVPFPDLSDGYTGFYFCT